jgi:hypothetical protein
MNMFFFRKSLLLAAFIVFTAFPAIASTIEPAARQNQVIGIVLGQANCDLRLSGVKVKSARVYGHKSDLVGLLDNAWKNWRHKSSFFCARCPCVLVANVGECVFNESPKVDAQAFGNIPPGKIIIIIDDASEFATSYKASLDSTGKQIVTEGSSCPTSELCINSKGEASYSLECEGYGFEVSTSGTVKVTVRDVTVPIIKDQ